MLYSQYVYGSRKKSPKQKLHWVYEVRRFCKVWAEGVGVLCAAKAQPYLKLFQLVNRRKKKAQPPKEMTICCVGSDDLRKILTEEYEVKEVPVPNKNKV